MRLFYCLLIFAASAHAEILSYGKLDSGLSNTSLSASTTAQSVEDEDDRDDSLSVSISDIEANIDSLTALIEVNSGLISDVSASSSSALSDFSLEKLMTGEVYDLYEGTFYNGSLSIPDDAEILLISGIVIDASYIGELYRYISFGGIEFFKEVSNSDSQSYGDIDLDDAAVCKIISDGETLTGNGYCVDTITIQYM